MGSEELLYVSDCWYDYIISQVDTPTNRFAIELCIQSRRDIHSVVLFRGGSLTQVVTHPANTVYQPREQLGPDQ